MRQSRYEAKCLVELLLEGGPWGGGGGVGGGGWGGGGGGGGTAVPRKKMSGMGGQYFLEGGQLFLGTNVRGGQSCLGMNVRGDTFFQGGQPMPPTPVLQIFMQKVHIINHGVHNTRGTFNTQACAYVTYI